jgi:hypothetical protein
MSRAQRSPVPTPSPLISFPSPATTPNTPSCRGDAERVPALRCVVPSTFYMVDEQVVLRSAATFMARRRGITTMPGTEARNKRGFAEIHLRRHADQRSSTNCHAGDAVPGMLLQRARPCTSRTTGDDRKDLPDARLFPIVSIATCFPARYWTFEDQPGPNPKVTSAVAARRTAACATSTNRRLSWRTST